MTICRLLTATAALAYAQLQAVNDMPTTNSSSQNGINKLNRTTEQNNIKPITPLISHFTVLWSGHSVIEGKHQLRLK